jgi:hypothetical protein
MILDRIRRGESGNAERSADSACYASHAYATVHLEIRDPRTDDWTVIMRNVAVAIAILGAAAGGLVVGSSSSGPSETAALPATATVSPTFSAVATPTGNAGPPLVSDADAHGFLVFGEGARCFGSDNVEMFMRTEKSALVVCRSEINRL